MASIGIHTGAPPSVWPGSLSANSTRAPLPAIVSTFFAYCSGVSTCSSSISNCTSPQVPRVFTLVSTRFRSPTPSASCCISPRPWCTRSSRSDTCWNDALKRASSVACSFSSTVLRIFFQTGAVVGLQILDLGFQRGAHFLHARGVRFGQAYQRQVHALGELLQAAALLIAANQALRFKLAAHGLELLHAGCMRGLRRGLQLHPHFAFDTLDAFGQAAIGIGSGSGSAARAQQRQQL